MFGNGNESNKESVGCSTSANDALLYFRGTCFSITGRRKGRSAFVKFKIYTYSAIIIVGSRPPRLVLAKQAIFLALRYWQFNNYQFWAFRIGDSFIGRFEPWISGSNHQLMRHKSSQKEDLNCAVVKAPQYRQYTYNVTSWCVRVTIVAVGKQWVLSSMSVCLCSRFSYPACKVADAPSYTVICNLSCSATFFHIIS